ncbi:MAG: hypothetical protein Q4F41_10805 [Eubacteriales bacterium]|nr:hypothetical protein [Eubacteriales bacterium]
MRKKEIAVLAACGLCLAGVPLHSYALTVANGTDVQAFEETGSTRCFAAEKDIFERQLEKESLAYLEAYGVTFDVEENKILYEDETVRWLIDERPGYGGEISYYCDGGKLDLYTVRDENGAVTGVRQATAEESAKLGEMEERDTYVVQEESVTFGSRSVPDEEEQKRIAEYAEIGIKQDENGAWTWEGQRIYMLLDDDGGIYQCGDVEERIYVSVERDEKGNAVKAEVISAKELLEKKALQDIKGAE